MVSRSAVLLSSRCETYGAGGILLLGALAVDLEGDTVGGGALDLKGSSRGVIEVLVQQLLFRIASAFSNPQQKDRGKKVLSQRISYIVGQLGDVGESWNGHFCGI